MKNLIKLALFIIFITGIIASCKKKDSNNDTSGNSLTTYPMQVGYSWTYQTVSILSDSATSAVVSRDTTKSYWTVVADTTINSTSCKKVNIITKRRDSIISTVSNYYAVKSDGLYGIASNGTVPNIMFKKYQSDDTYSTSGLQITRSESSTGAVIISPSPLYLIKFPYVNNEQWISNEWGVSANTSRKWIGTEDVVLPSGVYNCEKLNIILSSAKNSTFTQYFSQSGLIKEVQNQTSLRYAGGGPTQKLNITTILTSKNF